ncbi:MAG: TPM domain-containing protein, partial [Deltaproteobacteria bacterium]|nr:TPM domain-containing protein [Deltaproteobacteria bacterium]
MILVAREDRRFRVETGYGLEAVLPDAICKRLMDQWAVPRFKTGEFGLGIHSLAYALAERVVQSEGRSLQVSPPESSGAEAIPANEPPADNAAAQALNALADEAPPPFPWWKGLNGAVPVVITFFVLLYRGTRILLSKAYASRKLFYGDDVSGFPVTVWVLTFFGTIFFANIANAFVLPAGSFLLGGGLCTGLWMAWRGFFRSRVLEYARTCPQCGQKMRRMDEKADDALLTQAQRDEERAQGMDYEFWDCPGCAYQEHFEVKLPFASKCPKCGYRTLHSKTTVLHAATTSSSGSKRIDEDCYYVQCKYHTSKTVTIPRVSSSSSSSGGGGSSGGSFG